MAKVLLIDDLPPAATEGEVRELFSSLGLVISLERPPDGAISTRAKAYVAEFASDEEAASALSLDGKGISVSLLFNGTLKAFVNQDY